MSTPLVTRLHSEPRTSTASYYQHPALRGCHPFSLELAISHNRNLSSCRTADASPYTRPNHSRKSPSETNSDVEMTSTADDRDREIDLSLKPDSNHTRSSSLLDEEKISPSPEHDNSFESSESVEPHPGIIITSCFFLLLLPKRKRGKMNFQMIATPAPSIRRVLN